MSEKEKIRRLPEFVKIGAYQIPVKVVPNLIADQAATGMYIPRLKEIHIEESSCFEQKQSTLVHEILEAISEIYEVQCFQEDHHSLTVVGEGFYQVLKENPGLIQ